MTDKQQEAIAMLNDMYCSQSKEFQFRYKKNYFALVEFIMGEPEATIAPYGPQNELEPYGMVPVPDYLKPAKQRVEEHARELISNVLEKTGGDRKKAAQMLGVSDRTLYRRMKQYGIDK